MVSLSTPKNEQNGRKTEFEFVRSEKGYRKK
jgi:hypothetical protein